MRGPQVAHETPCQQSWPAVTVSGPAWPPSGVELLGPDGLLSRVTKAVLERALAEEITARLGYEKHDPAGRGSGNSRNGSTAKPC